MTFPVSNLRMLFKFSLLSSTQANLSGHASCPCLSKSQLQAVVATNTYTTKTSSRRALSSVNVFKVETPFGDYYVDDDYGTTCAAHDLTVSGACATPPADMNIYPHTGTTKSLAPNWCKKKWCYVDVNNCDGAQQPYISEYVKNTNANEHIYYSFMTCESPRSWTGDASSIQEVIENYVIGLKSSIESYWELKAKNALSATTCGTDSTPYSSTDYASCAENVNYNENSITHSWPANIQYEKTNGVRETKPFKFNFGQVGVFQKSTNSNYYGVSWDLDMHDNRAKCLVKGVVKPEMLKIADVEHLSTTNAKRLGYLYLGLRDGTMVEYPRQNALCASSYAVDDSDRYDPRWRPWYVLSTSGTKDVVIVIDTSGSMNMASGTQTRMDLAKLAAKAVIRTLSWLEFVSVVAFSTDVIHATPHLVPATDSNKAMLNDWIDGLSAGGTTNYIDSLHDGLKMLVDAKNAKTCWTSQCTSMLLFLSDGKPTVWSESNAADLANVNSADGGCSWAQEMGLPRCAQIYTYLLGSSDYDAVNTLKSVATLDSSNQPGFTQVSDGGDLVAAMAEYTKGYAKAMDKSRVRWVRYQDFSTQTTLYAGCAVVESTQPALHVGDAIDSDDHLLGVVCMDVNLAVDTSTLQAASGYSNFARNIEKESRKCAGSDVAIDRLEDAECQDLMGEVGLVVNPGETVELYEGDGRNVLSGLKGLFSSAKFGYEVDIKVLGIVMVGAWGVLLM